MHRVTYSSVVIRLMCVINIFTQNYTDTNPTHCVSWNFTDGMSVTMLIFITRL